MELMQEAIHNMKELSMNAHIIDNSAKNDVEFIFELDEHQYELQRHILCRECYVCYEKRNKASHSGSHFICFFFFFVCTGDVSINKT